MLHTETNTTLNGEEALTTTTGKSARSLSMNDMDSSTQDFWNMTLDDLDDEMGDMSFSSRMDSSYYSTSAASVGSTSGSSATRQPSRRSSMEATPVAAIAIATAAGPTSRQARRMSDGMIGVVASKKKTKATRSRPEPRRSVTFGQVRVRTCERVLGDNPSCRDGPSLSLGWKIEKETNTNLDAFEKKRGKERKPCVSQLVLTPEKREKIAKRSGYSKKDIEENVKQTEKIQRRRERTRKEVEKAIHQELLEQSNRESTLTRFLRQQASVGRHSNLNGALRI